MTCVICNGKNHKEIFGTQNFRLFRCENCRVVKTVGNFDDKQYDNKKELQLQKMQKEKFEKYAKDFAKSLPIKSGSLLDVGCGLGWFVKLANQIGFKAEGIDKGKGYIGVKKSWPLLYRGKPKKFSIITANHVIEHIDNPVKFLKQIKNHLKKDGWVQFSCPNFDSLMCWVFQEKWYGLVPHQHRFQYSPTSLKYLFKKNSFKIEKIIVNNLDYQVKGWKGIIFQCLLRIADITNTGDQVTIQARL